MLRFILLSIALTIVFRAVSSVLAGVIRGLQGDASPAGRTGGTRVQPRGVQMARDPVCGTFVVPERAVALSTSAGQRLYFCSTDCRDKYRARPQHDHAPAHGRTA